MRGVETILFLVVLGTVVAAFAGRLRVPAPSLLVIAGLVVALLPGFPPVHVPPDVVSLVVLPPLLYAASEELPWRDLRAVWRPVTVLAAGGAAVGGVIAAGVIPVRRRVTDPVLETVLALVTPYAAFVLGEVLHVSPVMAVIVAGLAIGARRDRITTAQTRLQLHSVYQTVIFLLESVVFSLIGLQLPTLIRDLSRTEAWLAEALAVTGTLIVIRIVWVFPLSAIIQRRGGARRPS